MPHLARRGNGLFEIYNRIMNEFVLKVSISDSNIYRLRLIGPRQCGAADQPDAGLRTAK